MFCIQRFHRFIADIIFMKKTVEIVYDANIDVLVAGFYVNGREQHRKILNDIEIDGLKTIINFEMLPVTLDANKLLNDTDKIVFNKQDN